MPHRSPYAVLLLLILPFLWVVGCQRQSTTATDRSLQDQVSIRVQKARALEGPETVRASGSVEPESTRHLAFLVAGRVERVNVQEGQLVTAGQVLATLETADYEFALRAAQGQAASAEATLNKAREGPRPQDVEQARIDYERWNDEYARMKMLFERKSLPANDFRKVEAAWRAASERYEMAKLGTRAEDKAAAEGQFRQAEAMVSVNRKHIMDASLRSPIPGYVGMRQVEVGDVLPAGRPVITVMNLNPVKVHVGIPESDIGKVRIGGAAHITIPALGGRSFAGKVELVGVAADPTSRTYSVKIAVPNPTLEMRDGMIAEASIEGAARVSRLLLPPDAIVRDSQGATSVFIYFPDTKRVYRKRVVVGDAVGSEVEIQRGLTGDELVVVKGQNLVREGSSALVEGGAR